ALCSRRCCCTNWGTTCFNTTKASAAKELRANAITKPLPGGSRGNNERYARKDLRLNPSERLMLVGDGIENPANPTTMVHTAAMFGAKCRFRDTKGLVKSNPPGASANENFTTITSKEIQGLHSRIIAFDNLPGARDVYGFDAGRELALLVGNERRGLSHE